MMGEMIGLNTSAKHRKKFPEYGESIKNGENLCQLPI
jgi:hypothetical protein